MGCRGADQLVELVPFAFGTLGLLVSSNKHFKLGTTVGTFIFIDWHGQCLLVFEANLVLLTEHVSTSELGGRHAVFFAEDDSHPARGPEA